MTLSVVYSRKGGFTLVELIVVMVVVLLLGGLLIPALLKGVEMSRTAKCASNLRTLGLGYMTYLNDNDGVAPVESWIWPTWIYNLMPYVMGASEFDRFYHANMALPQLGCPKSTLKRTDYWYTDYAINLEALSSPASTHTVKPVVQSQDAQKILLACDFVDNVRSLYFARYTSYQSRTSEIFRHVGRANCVYLDGHVGSIEAVDVKAELFQVSQ